MAFVAVCGKPEAGVGPGGLTGAAVREPTGIALPARYSTRDAAGIAVGAGGAVAADLPR